MKQKLFNLKSWLLMMCLLFGVGQSWAETYTIDFNKGTTNGTSIGTQLASQVATMCKSGSDYASSVTGTNCYYNTSGCGIRIGKSGGDGSLTVTFSSELQAKTVKEVIVYASAVASDNSLDVTPAGSVNVKTTYSPTVYSASNSESTNYKLTAIQINGTLNSLAFGAISKKYIHLHRIDVITSDVSDNRNAVNLTNFTATSTTLVKGSTTETSVTNDQSGWNAAYTYASNNESVATIDEYGVITAVGKGTAKVTASLNVASNDANYKAGSATSKTIDITVNNPSHIAKFSVNGDIDESKNQTVEEGAVIAFPENPSVEGVVFMGWTTTSIIGKQDAAPTLVTPATQKMGEEDITYYAVFAEQSGDAGTLTKSFGYSSHEGWTISSNAVDKNTYYLLQKNDYIESPEFSDLSQITKIELKIGKYNSKGSFKVEGGATPIATKGVPGSTDGSNYTFSGTTLPALSGTGKIKITNTDGANSGATNTQSGSRFFSATITYSTASYSNYCTTVSTKTLSSIAVKTAPTKVTYTEDEKFDPAGLVITATYDDESTEEIAYADNASAFEFTPSLTTALTPDDNSVTIKYKEKTTTQAITVNAIPTYTLTITQPTEGGTLTVKNGETALENGASVRVGTNLTCEVTGIPEGKRFSRFYAKWGEGEGESRYKATNPATFDNIATENITACEIYVKYMDIKYYTINYMINGVNTNPQENVEEKTALTFPTAPATIGGKSFVGWTDTEITGIVDEEPTLVNTSEQTATGNKTYYAVYATKGEGGAATYTKATSLAVGDKVVFGLGEADGKPEQAVTGANNGATISATESEWIVYTAVEYPEKGIVLQKPNGDYQRSAKGSFDFTSDNPSTMSTNANSYVIGYDMFTLYYTPQGNKFYSTKGTDYVEFLMWKVEGGASYSDFTTLLSADVTIGEYGYATFVAPCALDFTDTDVEAYSVTPDLANNEVKLTAVTTVLAGKAIVVKGDKGTYTIPATKSANDFETALEASTTEVIATDADADTYYYLGVVDEQVGFRPLAVNGKLAAGKCFFKVAKTPTSGAKFLTMAIIDDETTGISNVCANVAQRNSVYNLAGQRVNANAKGIVIVNGKKMLNK